MNIEFAPFNLKWLLDAYKWTLSETCGGTFFWENRTKDWVPMWLHLFEKFYHLKQVNKTEFGANYDK